MIVASFGSYTAKTGPDHEQQGMGECLAQVPGFLRHGRGTWEGACRHVLPAAGAGSGDSEGLGGHALAGRAAVGDRVAQAVAAMAPEPSTEAVFHEDSYDDAETLMLPTSVIAVIT
jgi:hypothetical protein